MRSGIVVNWVQRTWLKMSHLAVDFAAVVFVYSDPVAIDNWQSREWCGEVADVNDILGEFQARKREARPDQRGL